MDVPPPIYTNDEPSAVASSTTASAHCHHGAIVLDMQCFKDSDNDFLLKEVCVIDATTGVLIMHHIARPPFSKDLLTAERQRENHWLTRHCHGLEWDQGDVTYLALLDKLRTCLLHRPIVYVKGAQKRTFVRNHLLPEPAATVVQDLGDLGCASLSGLLSGYSIRCRHHKSVLNRCALDNCIVLRNWLLATETASRHAPSPFDCFCCFRPQ